MGTFKLGKMTLRSLVHKPATVRYPYEKRELARLFPHLRGHVVNDIDTCILCGMCQRACPVGAIAVDRKGGDWTIDPYRCIQCSNCVHECPKKCLSMDVNMTEPTTELHTTSMHKDMPAKPAKASGGVAKPKRELTPEQQARVEAARKAAAAKKAAKGDGPKEASPSTDDRAAKMEAKLAAMDPEKAAKVRAALAARAKKESE